MLILQFGLGSFFLVGDVGIVLRLSLFQLIELVQFSLVMLLAFKLMCLGGVYRVLFFVVTELSV